MDQRLYLGMSHHQLEEDAFLPPFRKAQENIWKGHCAACPQEKKAFTCKIL